MTGLRTDGLTSVCKLFCDQLNAAVMTQNQSPSLVLLSFRGQPASSLEHLLHPPRLSVLQLLYHQTHSSSIHGRRSNCCHLLHGSEISGSAENCSDKGDSCSVET